MLELGVGVVVCSMLCVGSGRGKEERLNPVRKLNPGLHLYKELS